MFPGAGRGVRDHCRQESEDLAQDFQVHIGEVAVEFSIAPFAAEVLVPRLSGEPLSLRHRSARNARNEVSPEAVPHSTEASWKKPCLVNNVSRSP